MHNWHAINYISIIAIILVNIFGKQFLIIKSGQLCPMIEDMADTVCPSFPPSQPCGCPLLAGDMTVR